MGDTGIRAFLRTASSHDHPSCSYLETNEYDRVDGQHINRPLAKLCSPALRNLVLELIEAYCRDEDSIGAV